MTISVVTPTTSTFAWTSDGHRISSELRDAISQAHRLPETVCVPRLIQGLSLDHADEVSQLADHLIDHLKAHRKASGVEVLIQEFSLSSQEGVALMCLAEALLRIPDDATRDALIKDKLSKGDWKAHLGHSSSLFVNAAAWGLMLTGKLVTTHSERGLMSSLSQLISKGGEPIIRRAVQMGMRLMGEQFIAGQTIHDALKHARPFEAQGFRYSYDMLGEAATTAADAQRYYQAYEDAIIAIGAYANGMSLYQGPGISIKLSALHPRYSRLQLHRVASELYPRLLHLVLLAKQFDIGINIDAEEADRLDISLDLLEALCLEPELAGWHGIGFVIQAYQKRAPYVIDYVVDLAKRTGHRLMIRLVKGAYWDSEIKRAQVEGLEDYPVYTRKLYTDIAYLHCAQKLLTHSAYVYPQFATHNAYTLAAIYHLAGGERSQIDYEFQCLHGMGETLYSAVVGSLSEGKLNRPCRIYAPVGTHDTLLAYLVRRLLENGANTSFVHQVYDSKIDVSQLTRHPWVEASLIEPLGAPHPQIPLPMALFKERQNSSGIDLSNEDTLRQLTDELAPHMAQSYHVHSLCAIDSSNITEKRRIVNPANHDDIVGTVLEITGEDLLPCFDLAKRVQAAWSSTTVLERAAILRKAADVFVINQWRLIALLVRESGKTVPNAVAELREAIDFLRYYAHEIETHFNLETHRPRGVIVSISPWNFPLAIFVGQLAGALAAGNVVIAKPAEQTPIIAYHAVKLLYQAGVPEGVLQLVLGEGETIGAALVAYPDGQGVMFTGSTQVAQQINQQLAQRLDQDLQPVMLIAETGGQNAMVVDSSALAEQVVNDVLMSAFDSAGQRCSALRVLCIQRDVFDRMVQMLTGAMTELQMGDPRHLSTDVGPVIDAQARDGLLNYITLMQQSGYSVYQPSITSPSRGYFIPPTLIEIDHLDVLTHEVFGPVLHVLPYDRDQQTTLIEQINSMGYGLTFGVHSRVDETIDLFTQSVEVGNIYVNRNMVGAVVGVQPFGGHGLSGTGPKAGGPLYLYRLLREYPRLPIDHTHAPMVLSGPTGEKNLYQLLPKREILCVAYTESGVFAQHQALLALGLEADDVQWWLPSHLRASLVSSVHRVLDWSDINSVPDVIFYEGEGEALRAFNEQVSTLGSKVAPVVSLSSYALNQGQAYPLVCAWREKTVSINTAAAGGNASLMTLS